MRVCTVLLCMLDCAALLRDLDQMPREVFLCQRTNAKLMYLPHSPLGGKESSQNLKEKFRRQFKNSKGKSA